MVRLDARVDHRDVDVDVTAVAADRGGRAGVGVGAVDAGRRRLRERLDPGVLLDVIDDRQRLDGGCGRGTHLGREPVERVAVDVAGLEPEARGDRSCVGTVIEDDDVAVGGGRCGGRHENGGAGKRRQAQRESLHLLNPPRLRFLPAPPSAHARVPLDPHDTHALPTREPWYQTW